MNESRVKKQKTMTEYYPSFIDKEIASSLYSFLAENIEWENGIFSKKLNKVSRSAYSVNFDNPNYIDGEIFELINSTLQRLDKNFSILDVYVNFYKDGTDCAPSHSHPGMTQLVISLGATRKLVVGKKTFSMENGDVVIFGSSNHEVPIEPEVKTGRISIATFMKAL